MRWGQFFTPDAVASFMAAFIESVGLGTIVRVLDPGAGTGVLGAAAAEQILANDPTAHVDLVFVEQEPGALSALEGLSVLLEKKHGDRISVAVQDRNFLDAADALLGEESLLPFDVVVSNPPYFKMSPSEPRGGDAPNAYARFMEVSLRLLRSEGQLIFIIPRSFAAGYYFRRFRARIHSQAVLYGAHVFESRRDVFKDEGVLQESIIVDYRKSTSSPPSVRISHSDGLTDLGSEKALDVPFELVVGADSRQVVSLPTSAEQLALLSQVNRWPEKLETLGWKISTGPVVAFRSKDQTLDSAEGDAVPLLWMNHVKAGRVTWPLEGFKKRQYIRGSAPGKLLVKDANYVVLRRFSAKEEQRRLTAACLLRGQLGSPKVGLENHLNFIHCPDGSLTAEEAAGLCTLLSTSALDQYFRISSGNTQVSATEIRHLPLPSREAIARIGSRVLAEPGQEADDLVRGEYSWMSPSG